MKARRKRNLLVVIENYQKFFMSNASNLQKFYTFFGVEN